MDTHPDEILEQVFSHLRPKDLLNARLVSKRWRRVSYSNSVQKRVVTVIRNYRDIIAMYSPSTAFTDQFKPVNLYVKIGFVDIILPTDIEEGRTFWNYRGRRIRELNVCVDSTHIKVLLDILVLCPNLKKLRVETNSTVYGEIIGSLSFHSVNFSKLLNLSVNGYYYLLFPLIERAMKNAIFLENIKFVCCGGSCFRESLHPPLHTSLELRNVSNLKSIHIDCSHVDDVFIDKLTIRFDNKLESISLYKSGKLSDLALKYLRERCTCLKALCIGKWRNRTFSSRDLFLRLALLTTVSIFCSYSINNGVVVFLGSLPNLAYLGITHCANVTDEGICGIFNNNVKNKIRELRLVELDITDRVMRDIAPLLPNLRTLSLRNCRHVTAASLDAVANNNRLLQCLTITGSNELSLVVLRSLHGETPLCINRMADLMHLTIVDCGVGTVSNALSICIKLPRLKVLDYDSTYNWYIPVLRRNPSLKYINQFCCQTRTWIINSTNIFLRKKRLLECYDSPLGICNVVRPTIDLRF